MMLSVSLMNGLGLALEHVSGDEDDDYSALIVLTVLCFRFILFM